jgi:hypothetical protein
VQIIQEGWRGGAGKVRVEVGVALSSNPLSKRYFGYEVGEVGVVQQPYILDRDSYARTARRESRSMRMKLRLA